MNGNFNQQFDFNIVKVKRTWHEFLVYLSYLYQSESPMSESGSVHLLTVNMLMVNMRDSFHPQPHHQSLSQYHACLFI